MKKVILILMLGFMISLASIVLTASADTITALYNPIPDILIDLYGADGDGSVKDLCLTLSVSERFSTITMVTFKVGYYDGTSTDGPQEWAHFTVNGVQEDIEVEGFLGYLGSHSWNLTSSQATSVSLHIEPFIKADALLDSDFYFDYARLTVVGTLAPVPIPGAFWLLGSGILGLAGISRRKKIKRYLNQN